MDPLGLKFCDGEDVEVGKTKNGENHPLLRTLRKMLLFLRRL